MPAEKSCRVSDGPAIGWETLPMAMRLRSTRREISTWPKPTQGGACRNSAWPAATETTVDSRTARRSDGARRDSRHGDRAIPDLVYPVREASPADTTARQTGGVPVFRGRLRPAEARE